MILSIKLKPLIATAVSIKKNITCIALSFIFFLKIKKSNAGNISDKTEQIIIVVDRLMDKSLAQM